MWYNRIMDVRILRIEREYIGKNGTYLTDINEIAVENSNHRITVEQNKDICMIYIENVRILDMSNKAIPYEFSINICGMEHDHFDDRYNEKTKTLTIKIKDERYSPYHIKNDFYTYD
jgi:hypothetical protein